MEKFFTEWERIEFLILKASKKTKPNQRSNAIPLLSEAIGRIADLPDANSRVHLLMAVATTYQDLNLKDLSLEILEQALNAVESCESESMRAGHLSNIGYQYVKLDRPIKGFELLGTALNIAANLEDVDERDLIFCEIASNYGYLGRIDTALQIARRVQDEYRITFRVLKPLQIDPEAFFSADN